MREKRENLKLEESLKDGPLISMLGRGIFSGPSSGDKDQRRVGLGQEGKRVRRLGCGRPFVPQGKELDFLKR
jgi:hypothetical protein